MSIMRIALAALALAGATLAAQAPVAAPKNDYSVGTNWLCRPGRSDACAVDLSTTVIAANGTMARETFKANPDAPIDCFYVYPTVSRDSSGNSDMIPGSEETGVVFNQFARFASQCRPYAPMYRQITLTALRKLLAGQAAPFDRALAYNDVRDAWNYYLEHDNNGRGVVLIGHSQGSIVLVSLIQNEIDGKPVQSRLVSAMLMGTSLPVPRGKDIGGGFKNIPLCHSATQTGCAITYASFRAESPPPMNAKFSRVAESGMISACTNPAALGGGSGDLHGYFSNRAAPASSAINELFDLQSEWLTPPQLIKSPFVSLPGFLSSECVVSADGASYLAISVHADPAGPRTKMLKGDVVVNGQVQADWGLHLLDVNEAIGNLVEIVGSQGKAYAAAHPR
jgi:hypothetical protein